MPGHRILVLFNEPVLPRDHPDAESEHSIVEIATEIAGFLKNAGYFTSLSGLKADPALLCRVLDRHRPDAVFNLFEGNPDRPETESFVAALLEWRRVPFTGCPHQSLTMARNKPLAKQLLRGAGLPTAPFILVDALPLPVCKLPWPVFVKPAQQDASVGVDDGSVCTNQKQLAARVKFVLDNYGTPALIEEFIDGREINVGLVDFPELHTLPPAEILFHATGPGVWPILSYTRKWSEEPDGGERPTSRIPADIGPRLAARLDDIAQRAFRLLECRHYARVDFRVRRNRPYILEVNPNPQIDDDTGFGGSLKAAGISYEAFVVKMIEHVLRQ